MIWLLGLTVSARWLVTVPEAPEPAAVQCFRDMGSTLGRDLLEGDDIRLHGADLPRDQIEAALGQALIPNVPGKEQYLIASVLVRLCYVMVFERTDSVPILSLR